MRVFLDALMNTEQVVQASLDDLVHLSGEVCLENTFSLQVGYEIPITAYSSLDHNLIAYVDWEAEGETLLLGTEDGKIFAVSEDGAYLILV